MFVTFVKVETESKSQNNWVSKIFLSTSDFHILLMSLELNRGLLLLTMGHCTWQQSTSKNKTLVYFDWLVVKFSGPWLNNPRQGIKPWLNPREHSVLTKPKQKQTGQLKN